MKIGTSNIHNAIKFTVSIAYDAYVDIFYGSLLFHQGRFVFVSKNILLVSFLASPVGTFKTLGHGRNVE